MGGLEVVAWELVEAEVVEVVEEVAVVEVVGVWRCTWCGGGGGGVSMDAKVPTSVHNQCVTNHGVVPHANSGYCPRVSSPRAKRALLSRAAATSRCLPVG